MDPSQIEAVCGLVREMLAAEPCSGLFMRQLHEASVAVRLQVGSHTTFHNGREVSSSPTTGYTLTLEVNAGVKHTHAYTRDERETRG